jgi:hypothetical protein
MRVVNRVWSVALATTLLLGSVGRAHAALGGNAPTPTLQNDGRALTVLPSARACGDQDVQQAVWLIYDRDDLGSATNLAAHCEALAHSQARALDLTMATRIRALIAMRVRDLAALRSAGEQLVSQAPESRYVVDGHLFAAFACLFTGNAPCARQHMDAAKALFSQQDVHTALLQIQPLEQGVAQLEAAGNSAAPAAPAH